MGYTKADRDVFEEDREVFEEDIEVDLYDPTFENSSYETPIYRCLYYNILQFLQKIRDNRRNVYRDTIVAEVNCNNKILRHHINFNNGIFEDRISIYLMKYFSHTFSTFYPKGKYHYSNDAENYNFGDVTTDEIIFDKFTKSKVRNIILELAVEDDYHINHMIFDAR